jgi:hypothetical protein
MATQPATEALVEPPALEAPPEPQETPDAPEGPFRLLPAGRTLREELRQWRYAALAVLVLVLIVLQVWVLF